MFPAATKEATVNVPAAHPELIAVGATINRTSWTDRTGAEVGEQKLALVSESAELLDQQFV